MNDDPFAGLSSLEATERLARFGPNALKPHRQAVWRQFLGRFANPLVLLLLAASAVSAATGDATSAGVIATIVALSVILDFTQERRAGQAAEQLARQVAQRVRVWRDDREQQVAADALVPGDVVLLSAGDLIPADCELLRAQDFFVNQALLTGEPYPVERRPTADALPERGDWDTDAPGALFRGSSVVSGSARALVRRTARRTAIGRIASSLEKPPPPTAFETGTRRFGLLIMRLTLLLVLFTLGVNLAFQRPLLESFMFAVALAVGLTPELLPMVVSVTLARGALRMARAQVIVKRLSAIQDMGAMDVLCTDKTGTLTQNNMAIEALMRFGPEGRTAWRARDGDPGEAFDELRRYGVLASEREPVDPMERDTAEAVPCAADRSVGGPDGNREATREGGHAADMVVVLVRHDDRVEVGRLESETREAADGLGDREPAVEQQPGSIGLDDETIALAAAAEIGETHDRWPGSLPPARIRTGVVTYLSCSTSTARMRFAVSVCSGTPSFERTVSSVPPSARAATLIRY